MVLKLYLVQHAEAKSKAEDPERPLSDKGLTNIKKIAEFAKQNLCVEVAQIFHSGKLRAKQTAVILAERLSSSKEVIVNEALEPLADPKVWRTSLEKVERDIMLVGHLPHLSKLASDLLCSNEDSEVITFRMGAISCLERDHQKHWAIQWIITPDNLP
jgi:phosphohistidine phosphatase